MTRTARYIDKKWSIGINNQIEINYFRITPGFKSKTQATAFINHCKSFFNKERSK